MKSSLYLSRHPYRIFVPDGYDLVWQKVLKYKLMFLSKGKPARQHQDPQNTRYSQPCPPPFG